MSWPLASHFSAMLQSPQVAFRDPPLQALRFEKDAMNQPRPWSGAFAVVYKGLDPAGKPTAVRVFTSESPERRQRYDEIAAHLQQRRLGCLVDFEYRDRSIRSAGDGKWYPLILMDWVDGETLFDWVAARCRARDRKSLERLAHHWVSVNRELAEARIAHGDLQHANAMVTAKGQIKLVDYDGMCVPALVGRRNLEVGVEPYQHPERSAATLLSSDLDNFSALVIYVALRALAARPELWTKHVDDPGYDKLLLRRDDLANPGHSAVMADLRSSPDREVRDLADKAVEAFRGRIDQVPPLGAVANSYARIAQLLRQQQWSAAVKLLNRRGRFRDAPEELKPLIREAYEQVCRQQAWEAFQALPCDPSEEHDRQLIQAWNEGLFAGFDPAERERFRVTAARQRLETFQRLYHLAQQAGSSVTAAGERAIVEQAQHLPLEFRHSLAARVAQARRRLETLEGLEGALADGRSEAAIVSAWQAVRAAQCTELFPPGVRARVELAEERLPVLAALREISPRLPLDQLDRRMLSTWRADLLADCAEAAAWLPLYETAVRRKEVLGKLQQAVEVRDGPAMVALGQDPCMAGYPLSAAWAAVIKAACELESRSEELLTALRTRQRERFVELFDGRLIRQYAERFVPYRALLAQWTRSELAVVERLGMGPSIGRSSLVPADAPPGAYRVRWAWPYARFAEQCLLAVCRDEPLPNEIPAEIAPLDCQVIDRTGWENAGGQRLLTPEKNWAGACVVVWARIDLGFESFYSEPLVLGRLPAQGRGLWSRLAGLWRRPAAAAGGKGGTPALPPTQGEEVRRG